ncbi:hypothetical protein [Candidatus Nitrososphaera evergladensis]|nr:hypothetical protein [Candidatus Nitrososphaera evergladensis]
MSERSSLNISPATKELVAQCGIVSESYDQVLQKIAKFYLANAGTKHVVSKENGQSAPNTPANTTPIGETGDAN